MIPFIEMFRKKQRDKQKDKKQRDKQKDKKAERRLVVAWGQRWGMGSGQMGTRGLILGDGNVLKPDCGAGFIVL